jgi:hypothetical protein
MGEASYTYLVTELTTGRAYGELHPTADNLSFDDQFNTPGNMTCTVPMDDNSVPNEFLINNTTPARTGLWAYRENKVVWGGIIWSRAYDSSSGMLSLTAQTFDTYAMRRYPRSWLGTGKMDFDNIGQAKIINDLWHRMQGVDDGSIHVEPIASDSILKNEPLRSMTVNGNDLTKRVSDYINDILAFSNGPDYIIEFYEDGWGLPKARLRIGINLGSYQTTINIGGDSGNPSLVADYPSGSVYDYTYTEVASTSANRWYTNGSMTRGVGKHQKTSNIVGQSTSHWSLEVGGFPMLEAVSNHGKVKNQDDLNDIAEAHIDRHPTPMVIHSVDVIGSHPPEFGTYKIGDYWIININDRRFPNGVSFIKRVVGWKVNPPDTNQGVETVSLVWDEMQPQGTVG